MGSPVMEEGPSVHEEFFYCCGAATQILKFGAQNLHSPNQCQNSPRLLFLVIPGNPGIVGYYKTFMKALYLALSQEFPVWAVSHAGHCVTPEGMEMREDSDVVELEDVFGLNGQIEHKLAFLRKNVPKDVNLVLIGHSIGCYIILEMMKKEPQLKVLKSLLLFPTIEHMAQSPQGKILTPVLCRLRYVIYVPVYMLSFLPESIKASMVRFVLQGLQSLDETTVSATVNLFNVGCLANAMYMGSQEMMQVLDRDSTTIKNCLDKLIFYYGATDHWCPVEYYEDIKKEFPDGDIRL
nr:PREDICTED: lipid droplet-associated hydrolase [Latimeria chalumnae]|eukprot:XP_014346245.1 PREDICTED: lipid droplet-associated hydrolase [Latimeria chalumnae]